MDTPPKENEPRGLANSLTTQIEHHSKWDIDKNSPVATRNTKIICTIGPASQSVDNLVELIQSGMNIVRMNFSHDDPEHKFHLKTIENVCKAVEKVPNCHVAIALDTKGREIRTGNLKEGIEEIVIETGNIITLSTSDEDENCCDQNKIYVDYKNITKVVSVGSLIYIDDGLISLKVTEIDSDRGCLKTKAENGGIIESHKGVNLPDVKLDLPIITEKDENDLQFGVEKKVDMVFASFIQDAEDVIKIRKLLGEKGKHIAIVSKIESKAGVRKFDEILKESDGIMVARGDLGIEIPAEKVFLAQKMMISKCNKAGKPVIVATHMLQSMIENPRPTRAEANDVASAVLDGTDCVMLSGESAKGKHPIKSVEIMSKICKEAEAAMPNRVMYNELCHHTPTPTSTTTTTAIAAVNASLTQNCAAIICLTTDGKTAFSLSKYRPRCPIIAITYDGCTARMCNLYRGVHPYVYSEKMSTSPEDWIQDVEKLFKKGMQFGHERKFIHPGNTVVLVNGSERGPGHTNTIRILTVEYCLHLQ